MSVLELDSDVVVDMLVFVDVVDDEDSDVVEVDELVLVVED